MSPTELFVIFNGNTVQIYSITSGEFSRSFDTSLPRSDGITGAHGLVYVHAVNSQGDMGSLLIADEGRLWVLSGMI